MQLLVGIIVKSITSSLAWL